MAVEQFYFHNLKFVNILAKLLNPKNLIKSFSFPTLLNQKIRLKLLNSCCIYERAPSLRSLLKSSFIQIVVGCVWLREIVNCWRAIKIAWQLRCILKANGAYACYMTARAACPGARVAAPARIIANASLYNLAVISC